MRFSRRKCVLGTLVTGAVVIPASIAWACVGLVVFTTTDSATVRPGGTVEVFGGEFAKDQPVDIHLDSPDGPVLATFPAPQPSTMTSRFTLDVPIPDDIAPGEHLLVATQQHYDMNGGIPARAVIYVGDSQPAEPTPTERPTSILASSGPSTGSLVLIGALTAGAALLLAAVARAAAARRPSPAATGNGEA